MLKKISTSLFLIIYLSVSTVSFADEVLLEIVSDTSPVVETVVEPVVENIPEAVVSEVPAPVVETLPEPVIENIPEEIILETPVLEEVTPPVVS